MSRTANDAQQIDNGDQQREGVLDEYAQEGEYESSSDYDDELFVEKKEKSRRPKENSFTQQRLKAINPVLTAKTVIPLLVAIAIVFVPLGAAMWYASHKIEDITIDYSQCQNLASFDYWSEIPDNFTTYNFRNIDTNSELKPKFSWKLTNDTSQQFDDEKLVCQVQFEVVEKMKGPIFIIVCIISMLTIDVMLNLSVKTN